MSTLKLMLVAAVCILAGGCAHFPGLNLLTDQDKDGLSDSNDACPYQAEDDDGFQDQDGCPDNDNDNDRIPDGKDKCPHHGEDFDGFQDQDGCPDNDNDNDRIPDWKDECPRKPETRNGYQDRDGCPDTAPRKRMARRYSSDQDDDLWIDGDKIRFPEQVHFESDKAVIKPASRPIVTLMAGLIRARSHITRLRIEGHTDSSGNKAANLALSQARAEAVMAHLIEKGIPANRLEAKGYGDSVPIVPNETVEGRARNRRVEFTILEINGRPPARVGEL